MVTELRQNCLLLRFVKNKINITHNISEIKHFTSRNAKRNRKRRVQTNTLSAYRNKSVFFRLPTARDPLLNDVQQLITFLTSIIRVWDLRSFGTWKHRIPKERRSQIHHGWNPISLIYTISLLVIRDSLLSDVQYKTILLPRRISLPIEVNYLW